MGGVALGFLAEGVACDDRFPFFCGADEEVRLKSEALLGLHFEQAFQLRARSRVTSKDEIAALQQRSSVHATQLREKVAQVSHGDLLVTTDIDAPEKGQVDPHGYSPPQATRCRGRRLTHRIGSLFLHGTQDALDRVVAGRPKWVFRP